MEFTLYVAPYIKGCGDGSSAENAIGSLEAAIEIARKLPGKGTICMEPGEYFIDKTITLDARDSGLMIQGNGAILSSGVSMLDWRWEGDGIISAPVDPKCLFNRLYVNGAAREKTRLPDYGHWQTRQAVKKASLWLADMTPEQRQTSSRLMFFHTGDIPKELYRQEDIEFVVLQYWMSARSVKAESINHERGEVVLEQEAARPYCWSFGYYMENVREGLHIPGRWYRDYSENRIYYHLLDGETLDTIRVMRPALSTLIQTAPNEIFRDVHFRDITFSCTDANPVGTIHIFPQAELSAPTALRLTNAQHCSFERCHFAHLGGYGLWLRGNSVHCRVDHCQFTFCGAGAVCIGETRRANGIPDGDITEKYCPHILQESDTEGQIGRTSHIAVTNNRITDCGWYFHGAAGIWVGQAGHCTVSHNEISGPLMWAISVGWVWDIFPLNQMDSNRVEKNDIHDLGTGILGAHGAIYMLGVSPNTTVRGNYIRDVHANAYWGGGEGIILDNCCSGISVQDNIVLRASAGGWGCNFDCFGNVISNNIFCFGEKYQLTRYGDPPKTEVAPPNGEVFSQNIILWEKGPLFGETDWLSFSTFWDYNLYWCTSAVPTFLGRSFEQWKLLGMDRHSIIADPLFADPEHGDFALEADSPVHRIGFIPIDLEDVGILT